MANDDWTTGQFDESEDQWDHVDFGQGVADGKSVAQIEEDANLEVPKGEHTFFVKAVKIDTVDREGNPVLKFHEAYLGTEKTGYHAYQGKVILAMVSDPARTISVYFRTPPRDPSEVSVYVNSTSKPSGHKNGVGWWWKTLKHFLGHLGFSMSDNGQLPPEATTFGSWKRWPDGRPRTIVGKVVAGTLRDNDPPDKKVWNQIESFTFKDSSDTLTRRGSRPGNPPGNPPAGASAMGGTPPRNPVPSIPSTGPLPPNGSHVAPATTASVANAAPAPIGTRVSRPGPAGNTRATPPAPVAAPVTGNEEDFDV